MSSQSGTELGTTVAPAGMSDDLAATIEKAFSDAASTPKFKDAMEKLGGVQRVGELRAQFEATEPGAEDGGAPWRR